MRLIDMVCLGYWIDEIQWLTMVTLFIAALVTVSVYLVQYALVIVGSSPCRMSADSFQTIQKDDLGFLLKWVLSLNSWRRQWQVAWVTALNEEAKHKGGPLFLTFEEDQVQNPLELVVQPIVNVGKSVQKVVSYNVGGNSIQFIVHVFSASSDASKCQSYGVQLSPFHLQLELHMKEKREDILIKWSFLNASEINIKIQPKETQEDQIIGTLELSKALRDILKHLVSSVSPSVVLSIKTVDVREAESMRHTSTLPQDLCPPKPPRVHKLKLLVKNIQATLLNNRGSSGSLNCLFVTQLNDPFQKFCSSVTESTTNFTWDEVFTFELNARSKELQMHVLEDGKSKDDLFFALATVPIDVFKKQPSGQQCFVLNNGSSYNYTVLGSITAEFFYIEPNEPKSWKNPPPVPSAKMEKDQTVMPSGTTSGAFMVNSLTTMKTNPGLDVDRFSALNSELLGLNNSDPVAEAAVQQLSHSSNLKFKSPRKTNTIIIEGESKISLSQDSEAPLMIDYAASMDSTYQQEFPSYYEEVVSTELIDETLSKHVLPALETQENEFDTWKLERNAKSEEWNSDAQIDQDSEEKPRSLSAVLRKYKGGILRKGAKIFFHPWHHQKNPGMSQSNNDLIFLQQPDEIHRKSTKITRTFNKNLLSICRSKSKLNVFSVDPSL
ncbi:C2 domain-containing protein 2 isoform X1 [Sarcophilus harrisii]|uniref:C2 domain-containing protein 2 isoform X1 n=1 Tax=Sarcophilus harrisii TaxID=9305 RepID=UPI000226DC3F|nr:C2 domain-containing protein 2 isoform X1 [Sarcophilus harrisii]XP_023354607.1 C2 domain-containing protein 2 isoform X1 [Sarcophilus harrisii]XP_023354608.1 C2 domain-containing protein 2 isoform X1 [Sarcophilus harrisii]